MRDAAKAELDGLARGIRSQRQAGGLGLRVSPEWTPAPGHWVENRRFTRDMHYNSAQIEATHHGKAANYTDMGHKSPQAAHRALMRRRVGKKTKAGTAPAWSVPR